MGNTLKMLLNDRTITEHHFINHTNSRYNGNVDEMLIRILYHDGSLSHLGPNGCMDRLVSTKFVTDIEITRRACRSNTKKKKRMKSIN